jgi:hypothetical protein
MALNSGKKINEFSLEYKEHIEKRCKGLEALIDLSGLRGPLPPEHIKIELWFENDVWVCETRGYPTSIARAKKPGEAVEKALAQLEYKE